MAEHTWVNAIFIAACIIGGIIPGCAYILILLMGRIPRGSTLRSSSSIIDGFPVYSVSHTNPIYRVQMIGTIFFTLAAVALTIEGFIGDGSEDKVLCTATWKPVVFFFLCYNSSILWFMYFRAKVSTNIATYQWALKGVKFFLIAYCIAIPIAGTSLSESYSYTDSTGTSSCLLSLPRNLVYAFITADVMIELFLFLLFALPLRQLMSASLKMSQGLDKSGQDDRNKALIGAALRAFRNSCVLLFLNTTGSILVSIDSSVIGEYGIIGATITAALMFLTMVTSTRTSWEWKKGNAAPSA
jgi:hypothetical protein